MPAKSPEKLRKVTLNLFEEDWLAIGRYYPTLGSTRAVRDLLRTHVRTIQAGHPVPNISIDVEEVMQG